MTVQTTDDDYEITHCESVSHIYSLVDNTRTVTECGHTHLRLQIQGIREQ